MSMPKGYKKKKEKKEEPKRKPPPPPFEGQREPTLDELKEGVKKIQEETAKEKKKKKEGFLAKFFSRWGKE